MVDSHALVGSCAQIGKRVHLSAAAQIGGVLEPAGALPVIIEDDVLVGGNCGVYEGAIVARARRARAGHHPDRRHGGVRPRARPRLPAGRRPAARDPGRRRRRARHAPGAERPGARAGASALYTPVIVKYRDEKTDTAVRLEELLR